MEDGENVHPSIPKDEKVQLCNFVPMFGRIRRRLTGPFAEHANTLNTLKKSDENLPRGLSLP